MAMRQYWALLLVLAIVAAAPRAAAAADQILLDGTAHTGPDRRAVRFGFACTANSAGANGTLELTLIVPHADSLAPSFDVVPFEGPDAAMGALTELTVAGAQAARFAVAGWYGVDDDAPFLFGLSADRHDRPSLARLARVLRPLTEGAGRLEWRQGNPVKGGPPLLADLAVTAMEAGRLAALLAPCLSAAAG